jgi:hypothetical protein
VTSRRRAGAVVEAAMAMRCGRPYETQSGSVRYAAEMIAT